MTTRNLFVFSNFFYKCPHTHLKCFIILARIMIAVQKWGIFVTDEVDDDAQEDNYEHKVWQEGVLVTYDEGFFLVESFEDDVSDKYLYYLFRKNEICT